MQIHRAKKSLGQNFLKSKPALSKIIEAGEISKEDIILEIGPGKGALTEKLLENASKVIAIEKDSELITHLKEKFHDRANLELIEGDILEYDPPKKYKVIANIPYNITGAILKKFLTAEYQPERMVLLVQHEVAQRIVARDGKESILSISVKAYGTPKMLLKVPARFFSPSPKVDSAVIVINNISRNFFIENKLKENEFWEIVKKGFAHKRKKLSRNLKELFSEHVVSNDILVEKQKSEIKNKRAENLALEDWKMLAS